MLYIETSVHLVGGLPVTDETRDRCFAAVRQTVEETWNRACQAAWVKTQEMPPLKVHTAITVDDVRISLEDIAKENDGWLDHAQATVQTTLIPMKPEKIEGQDMSHLLSLLAESASLRDCWPFYDTTLSTNPDVKVISSKVMLNSCLIPSGEDDR